jgi:methylated-DNA-[protein]-cysteine S-methyltransferase
VEHLRVLRDELAAYFAGELRVFTVAVDAAGSAFQRGVWAELRRIGFGRTRSYGDVARALGKPGAARAVGLANGANPVPIVVPCHRVIGSDGSLAGFSAGVERKRWLLAHEGVLLPDATIGRRRQALLGDHAGPRVG